MRTNIRYILITALRDRLFVALLLGMIFSTAISAALGGTAFLEERAMTITYAAAAARIILMVGMIVFVCFHIRSAFDTKEIDVILSRPISRSNLVFAYWLGFYFVAILLAVPVLIILALIGVDNLEGYIGWSASLLLELGLVIALALFSALTLRSAVMSVLVCMGFYVLSRMMAFFLIAAESTKIQGGEYLLFKYILTLISSLVPRLDLYSKTEWLVYGFDTPQEPWLFVTQTAIFIPLLLLASMMDFKRKQF
ncbi:MAG: hypothetical protein SFT92_00025 [Rickettsiales bacterium]|nr:hypothetical protein [Rickettsiales bacterium]